MANHTTQNDRVLNYMKFCGTITRVEAMNYIGVANLTAVIDVLRNHKGIDIVTETVHGKNRFGEKCKYARYSLAKTEEE